VNFYRSLFFEKRFFFALFTLCGLFVIGYIIPIVFIVSKILLCMVAGLLYVDILLLYTGSNRMECKRILPNRLSMSDENKIQFTVLSAYTFVVSVKIIDELPVQFQIRDFILKVKLSAGQTTSLGYILTPHERGEFEFGLTRVFVTSPIGWISRRYNFNQPEIIPAYPSFIQMRKYQLMAQTNRMDAVGIKKVRKAGKHTEFDQVREYVSGDDFRLMNWKSTAKHAHLMVNQYQEERSKDIYSVIDMGRTMRMPFEGMSLLDYAINASLAISNISLMKHDKTGLITFSNNIHTFINADKRNNQLNTILETLYNQSTRFLESDYELLFLNIRKRIHQRSLLILYTNFEGLTSLQRQIPFMQQIARNHLLLVVIFENTEIMELISAPKISPEDVYSSVIAEKFMYEKKLMVRELQKHGISAILTNPHKLTPDIINKYLELKVRESI
jgi:uncharacterized protein (DUF58 family)